MKSRFAVLAAFLGLMAFSSLARADVFSVSLDLPLMFDPKFSQSGTSAHPAATVSGYKVGVSLPFLVGLGMENYTAKLAKKEFGSPSDIDYKVTMYDLFVNLPIPIVNIALGVGAGTAAFGTDIGFKDANLMQYWASLGIPFGMLDVHVGLHSISGTHSSKVPGIGDAKVEATMTSLGVKIGF
jgi:hypothetical protein